MKWQHYYQVLALRVHFVLCNSMSNVALTATFMRSWLSKIVHSSRYILGFCLPLLSTDKACVLQISQSVSLYYLTPTKIAGCLNYQQQLDLVQIVYRDQKFSHQNPCCYHYMLPDH